MPGRSATPRPPSMADYVLVDMFAEAVTGQATPQEAMEEAEKRANRYYRV